MIYSANLIEMAGKISHVDIVKYLRDLNWNELRTKRNYIKVFQLKNAEGTYYQATIPTSRELSDYNEAMYAAVENIAKSTNKSNEQVILELLNPLSDIIRVRVFSPEINSGSIFVEDAIRLYENSRKLLMAAAMDIKTPRRVHLGRPDSAIQEFVSNCRFGQTEIGSYVVSVVCPFADIDSGRYRQLSLFSDVQEAQNSITRNVTNKLMKSIKLIKDSIDEGNLDSTIDESLSSENAISATFLEALNAIGIYRENTQVDISVKWAPTIKNYEQDSETVTLTHDYYEPIDALVKKMKNLEDKNIVFIGKISSLHSAIDIDKRVNGTITLVTVDEFGRLLKAKLSLPREFYDLAISAHKAGKFVKVTGTLRGTGRSKEIACSDFVVDE